MGWSSAKPRTMPTLLFTLSFIGIWQFTSAQVFQSLSTIAENVANDVPLFDLTIAAPNSTYVITENSAKTAGMFDVSNGKLILNKSLSTTTRKLFDYEKFKTFNVNVTATSTSNRTDVRYLTIQLRLLDVDDEPPSFTNQPSPFLASVLGNASPGTLVYTITTNDPDSTSQPTVTITNQIPSNRFAIQPGGANQFSIVTTGDTSFPGSTEFTITVCTVSARDTVGNTQTADVKVLVGLRPPQFFSSPYTGQIYENIFDTDRNWLLTKDNQQLEIKARFFQRDAQIQIQLGDQSSSSQFSQYFATVSQTSSDPFTQSVKLRSSKVIDYEQLKSMTFVVSAQDTTNRLTSSVTVNIEVVDENDNAPTFSAPQYSTEVKEDLSVGSTVLSVQANDRDSGSNGELTFSILNSAYFNVTTVKVPGSDNNYNGIITVRSPLDYDKPPGPTYNFTLLVTDKGTSPRSASVSVLVSVTNVNDNNPIIDNSTSLLSLTETAQNNFVVTIIQASDVDGDSIRFYFARSQVPTIDIFKIDAQSGVIQLTSTIPKDRDSYSLKVLAVDDDRCCKDKTGSRTSSAVFTVNIIDINANKPSFTNCTLYDNIASVKEKAPIGTQVIQARIIYFHVVATDPDRGENGRVVYEIQNPSPSQPNAPFKIDQNNGSITVQTILTRGADSFIQVTVIGRNPTLTQMEGWCTFRVTIVDINDHPPTFTQPLYSIEIAISTPRYSTIRQMVAKDDDVGINAEMTYMFSTNDSSITSLFSIDANTGVIKLIGDLTSSAQAANYTLIVIATDHGTDPGPLSGNTTVVIVVKLNDRAPPVWLNTPSPLVFSISESAPIGTILATFICNSNIPDTPEVEFLVFEPAISITQDSPTFSPVKLNSSSMNLVLKSATALDYITKKQYQLSVVCQVLTTSGLTLRAEINPVINVTDANNQVPTFEGLSSTSRYVGTVAENSPSGATVLQISANDKDETLAFRTVTFKLLGANNASFQIIPNGDNRATIVTSGSISLDRETNEFYTVEIEARDGAPAAFPPNSTQPNIVTRRLDVRVTDVNDNIPSFDNQSYSFEIDEETPVGLVIASVTANDPDSIDQGNLNYRFETGNINNAFSILTGTGQIRVARRLDYENPAEPKTYRMQLIATDSNQLHSCSTTVEIKIRDINDNSPEFSQLSYSVVGKVVEEDTTVTPSNKMFLIQVHATDKDVNRTQTDIRYFLIGAENTFSINETSGEIYLIGKLDRDQPNPNYTFTARAEDERANPRFGYATVVVSPMDINDNAPVFQDNYLKGDVLENPSVGTPVLTVLARDIDYGDNGTVNYRIFSNQSLPDRSALFSVSNIGVITTRGDPGAFDRETVHTMYLTIEAFDGGLPQMQSTATVTINILDVNDNSPYFDKSLYTVTMSEATKFGSILLVSATDLDDDPRNRDLRFQLSGPQSTNFLVVALNQQADIRVATPVDYERDPHNFTFILHVDDRLPSHENLTQIQVFVTDYNDNPPIFKENEISVTLIEEQPPGQVIATFNATDADEGMNAQFEYSIIRASDPRYEFYIDPHSGKVTTRKQLDREVAEYMEVVIMAKDKGREIPLSSTALLKITLTDINDNAPSFLENYRPKVQENVVNNNLMVVEIFAKDPDKLYGPPFGFQLQTGCEDCAHFRLELNQARNGSAKIFTSKTFDRELRKYYHLPIVMWDLRGLSANNSMTATNTLTVVIGDDNDNNMKPGNQDIFVYNYEGNSSDVEIGRVYTDDPDDWDLPDKTFSNLQPTTMQKYFNVASDTGMVTMKRGVPVNGADPPYMFKVDVFDKKFNSRVTCTVSVTVMELSDEAVRKSGSIRLSAITAEEFVKRSGSTASSPYDKFKQQVANLLGYQSKDNVEIVSLTDVEGDLDVRYSAHSSPYLNPSQLESAVLLNLAKFETDVGVKVAQVPINLCTEELYDDGCYTYFNFTGQPRLINANGTSYLVMDTSMTAESGCVDSMFPDPVECRGDYCYNGGTCVKDDWDKLNCQCSPGFDGPRCQQRRHQFDGSSIAFYDSLSVCAEGRTSIDLITTQDDGLIMYSGAIVGSTKQETPKDFISLELKGGYPILTLNLGSDEVAVALDGKDTKGQTRMSKLSDGKWHTIHIDRDKQQVTLTVDHCETAAANASDGSVADWSPCTATGTVPGPDILLNVQSFLQLGGRYKSPATNGFSGCLRNLFHNTKLYDLNYRNIPNWKSGTNGCAREEAICGQGTAQPVCGEHATCNSLWLPNDQVASCRCDPGWYGVKCAKEAPTYDLKSQSFFKWNVNNTIIEQALRKMSLQMMFRTRRTTGTLLVLTNAPQNTIILQLEAGKLTLRYNMGKGENKIILDNAPANTGQWHTVRMERYGSEFILSMDGGEGRYYTYELALPDLSVFFRMLSYISAGARVQPVATSPENNQIIDDLINTCVRDIRLNDIWLPLATGQNSDAAGITLYQARNVQEGCTRDDCGTPTCPVNMVCFPLWEDYECRCAPGFYLGPGGVCLTVCTPGPCLNNGACTVVSGQATCSCTGGWTGKYCDQMAIVEDSGLSDGAIAGIVIAILVLLALLIAIIIFMCIRRKPEKEKYIMEVDPDDDFIRENVMYYDEEGAGEEDHNAYDLKVLTKPAMESSARPNQFPDRTDEKKRRNAPMEEVFQPPAMVERPDVGSFIKHRIQDTENDDPFGDSTHQFNFEGSNSDAGSLSSLNTSSSGGSQDYDYLSDWGPKFAKLADMYGAGQNLDEES
ncbi:unnamed protein product [Lymnaea stagnalis]|uniref:Uncharacterized protein n=1 Tax=Lymnaea stagnalis TaxID=6523 RepID=A0AAV2HL24_LYMST